MLPEQRNHLRPFLVTFVQDALKQAIYFIRTYVGLQLRGVKLNKHFIVFLEQGHLSSGNPFEVKCGVCISQSLEISNDELF